MKAFMTIEKAYGWARAFDLTKIVGYSNATGECPFARCWKELDPEHFDYHVGTHLSTRYGREEAAVKHSPFMLGYFDERFVHPPDIANAIYLVDRQHMNAGLPMPVTARAFCAILEEVHGGPFAGFESVSRTRWPYGELGAYFCRVCQEYHHTGPYALLQTTTPFQPTSMVTLQSIEAAMKSVQPVYSFDTAKFWQNEMDKEIVTPGYAQPIEDEPTHPLPVVKELVAV